MCSVPQNLCYNACQCFCSKQQSHMKSTSTLTHSFTQLAIELELPRIFIFPQYSLILCDAVPGSYSYYSDVIGAKTVPSFFFLFFLFHHILYFLGFLCSIASLKDSAFTHVVSQRPSPCCQRYHHQLLFQSFQSTTPTQWLLAQICRIQAS